jgi:hypothetical protein
MGRVGREMKAVDRNALKTKLISEAKKSIQAHLMTLKTSSTTTSRKAASADVGSFAGTLLAVHQATAVAAGTQVAKSLGGTKYDAAQLQPYLKKRAAQSAPRIIAAFQDQVDNQIEDLPEDATEEDISTTFDQSADSFSDSIAVNIVTAVAGLASLNSARNNGGTTKTWNAGGGTKASRSDHDAMDGESVGINDTFSNGMGGPGDPAGGGENNGGCLCTLSFQKADEGV